MLGGGSSIVVVFRVVAVVVQEFAMKLFGFRGFVLGEVRAAAFHTRLVDSCSSKFRASPAGRIGSNGEARIIISMLPVCGDFFRPGAAS